MSHAETDYPHLAHFLAGYLHQDWMLCADDLPGVARAYLSDEPPGSAAALRGDIARFLADHPDDTDRAYAGYFPNGVLPAAWDMDSVNWLLWVDRLLDVSQPAPQPPR